MGQWVVGAIINIVGSITINFGTNLVKLGHEQRERLSTLSSDGSNSKLFLKPITNFQTWRIGILLFAVGNCLNFISFAYAAQSLLAALGSIQFVSNIAFSYFVLSKMVTIKVMVATTFIVSGNIFLVSFGNHQSPVFTPEQLAEKYSNLVFLLYCLGLMVVVIVNHCIYSSYWRMLLPFSYAIVSGAVGSCSVLFAKSLSNMLRLTMSSNYHLHSWFTYSMVLLFFSTAGFWMARLNEGLSLFDGILIVPMFQISWTFFSICTGFIYFQEYQVFDMLRLTMFLLGMSFVFIGICLLAPDDIKGVDAKDPNSLNSSSSQSLASVLNRASKLATEDAEMNDPKSLACALLAKAKTTLSKAKTTFSILVGLCDESINPSSALLMPMASSRTSGFRGNIAGFIRLHNAQWNGATIVDDREDVNEDGATSDRTSLLS